MSMTVQPQPDRPGSTVIAAQNDAFRKLACLGVPPAQPIQGRMHVTRSLMEAGDGFMAEAVKAAGEFATFEPENDPEGWHDFGAVEIRGARPCSGKSICMRKLHFQVLFFLCNAGLAPRLCSLQWHRLAYGGRAARTKFPFTFPEWSRLGWDQTSTGFVKTINLLGHSTIRRCALF